MVAPLPVAEGVLELGDDPHLFGSRCSKCGLVMVPALSACIRCGSVSSDLFRLPQRGVLWTWTTQEFMPPRPPYGGDEAPEDFNPYLVGYVEFEGIGRIETRLVDVDARTVRIGDVMELVVVPFSKGPDDRERVTYAFRPAKD